MVGFDPAIKTPNHSSKLSNPEDQLDPLLPEFPDFSLSAVDPFDFGSIDDWILQSDPFGMTNEVNLCPNGSDFGSSEDFVVEEETHKEKENLTAVGSDIKMVEGKEDFDSASCVEVKIEKVISESTEILPEVKSEVNQEVGNEASLMDLGSSEEGLLIEKTTLIEDGGDMKLVEARVTEALGSDSCIEAKMEKVSLFDTSDSLSPVNGVVNSDISECLQEVKSQVNEESGNEVSLGVTLAKVENATREGDAESSESDDSDSDSESEDKDASSTTSSSSASSSDDEEDEKTVKVGEAEEGEIRDLIGDEMIGGSDDDDVGVVKGPIKSKNEIEVLPQVPNVDVSLKSHHQTLPVGVILTIMGAKVIVEGLEAHNPLNEGSILWITESRSLLGLVDEIFGPVKNPYYVVRYNSDKDVPAGIHEGTPVSFVAEFADHILNVKNLYKKGYDASGENDEELTDEAEFSDDEKEAEHKKLQRMAKRGSDDKKHGNRESFDRKKAQNKTGVWKSNQPPPPQLVGGVGHSPHAANITNTPPVGTPAGSGGRAQPFGTRPTSAYDPAFAPSVSQAAQANCYTPQHSVSSNGVWSNGMPCQQQQNMVFPNGFPTNGVPYQNQFQHQMLQNQFQNQLQNQHQMLQNQHQMLMGFSNGMPIQQQIPYGQPNFSSGPPISMPMFMGQTGFNQTQFGMGFQAMDSTRPFVQGEKVPSHRPIVQQSHGFNQAQPGMGFQGDHLSPNVNQGGQLQSQGPLNEQSQINFSAQQQSTQGETSTRGRRPYQRGRRGGYPSRGRGRR